MKFSIAVVVALLACLSLSGTYQLFNGTNISGLFSITLISIIRSLFREGIQSYRYESIKVSPLCIGKLKSVNYPKENPFRGYHARHDLICKWVL